MIKSLFTLLLLLSTSLVFSLVLSSVPSLAQAGGDYIGNGGGLAEKNIFFAFMNVDRYARLCLDVRSCRLTEAERVILADIMEAMKQERKVNPIQFASEKKQPGFFILNGEMKLAKTGSKVGSPIFVNRDMLYTRSSLGTIHAMSIADALAMLVHEIGHHVSDASHEALDLLGVKVSMFLQNQIQTTPLLPWNDQISATIVQPQAAQAFPQILLNVSDEILDLSKAFQDSVFCPKMTIPVLILPFPDLQFGNEPPQGTIFHNVHWEKQEREGLTGSFTILGNLTHICSTDGQGGSAPAPPFAGVNSFQYRISFQTVEKNGKPQLRKETITMHQSYEPWYKLIRFPH
jgi:hypothetical protein